MAPVIMGNADRPELGSELARASAAPIRTSPGSSRSTTFLSDNRADLRACARPRSILQCRDDAIAPVSVGEFVQRELAGSELVILDATGHCPNLSAPGLVVAAIDAYL